MPTDLWSCLHQRLDAAATGCGSTVLVAAGSGSGVTALVQAFALAAGASGVRVLAGRCLSGGETPPLGPWRALLGAAAAGLLCGERPPAAKAAGLLAWLGQQSQTALLLLEELQGADPASLDLALQVARLAKTHPVILLATYCPDDLHRAHPLEQALAELTRAGAATIRLAGPEDGPAPDPAEAAAAPSAASHLACAERLLTQPEPEAWAVAYHLLQARDPRAPAWLARACDSALSFGAGAQAAQACEWALELLPPGDPEQFPFLIRLGLCHCRLGQLRQALDCLEEALALARTHHISS